jgi:hypothetical protein
MEKFSGYRLISLANACVQTPSTNDGSAAIAADGSWPLKLTVLTI